MRALLQRVSQASVTVDGRITGKIGKGFVILLGVTHSDSQAQADWLANKIAGLRIFEDKNGKMMFNPEADAKFVVGDTIVVMGSAKSIKQLESRMRG